MAPGKGMGYRVSAGVRFFRWSMRPVFRGIFRLLSQVRIHGRENIPARGSYLIAINHISILEPPFLLAFWPVPAEAVGAVDIWHRPGQATLARYYGGIQVHRGEYDRQVVDQMLAALAAGRPLLIAPEGGRSHLPGLRPGLPGVAYVVDKARVPVLPVGITGTTEDFFWRALHGRRNILEMHIGAPLWLPAVEGRGQMRRAALQSNVDLIMRQIAALLPQEYRGVYGEDEHFSGQAAQPSLS
jgi:1-acyl-sn-glycerol-3-phosphate acyltransferase